MKCASPLQRNVFYLFLHGKIKENLENWKLKSCLCNHDTEWESLCHSCQESAKDYYRNLGFTEVELKNNDLEDEDDGKEVEELDKDEQDKETEDGEDIEDGELEDDESKDGEFEDKELETYSSVIFDTNEDPLTRKLIYLTPEMIELFKQGEIYRLNVKREKLLVKEKEEEMNLEMSHKKTSPCSSDTSSSLSNLKRIVDEIFEDGKRERTPILWPVLSMRF